MVSKKSSHATVSKVSSSAAPAAASSTLSATSSSILRSAFSPSTYQLSLFASVIQGLESQHLRIHDTDTGRLRCEHPVASKATISCLDWGYYSSRHQDGHEQSAKKKRKRTEPANGRNGKAANSDICVAFGTSGSDSSIRMFSPLENRMVGELNGVQNEHARGVRDFKFTSGRVRAEGWSLGNGDGKLVQWDLQTGSRLRRVSWLLPIVISDISATCTALGRPVPTDPPVICASHAVYIIDPESRGSSQASPFQASLNLVHTIITSSPTSTELSPQFLTAAASDRSMSVFDVKEGKLIGSLVAQNDVQRLAFISDPVEAEGEHALQSGQAIAALTAGNQVELFPAPFQSFGTNSNNTASLKVKRKQMTRKAIALVQIIRPDKTAAAVSLVDITLRDDDLLMVWPEGGLNLVFKRIRWRDHDSGDLLWSGTKEIIVGKSNNSVIAASMNGVKDIGKSQVDESHTIVASGGGAEDVQMDLGERDVIDISSGEEDSDLEDVSASESDTRDRKPELEVAVDEEMADAQDAHEENSEKVEEPSFGDLLRANAPEIIDVAATFDNTNPQALTKTGERPVQLPGMSLGTVLTQSLRTNDVNLLETCFHIHDLSIVRSTIERLDSSLAAVLLQKLAERLHSRPGRAGSMMVWVQWTLVAHGGYLANQPEIVKKLRSLHRVVKERANGLQSLLSLKGKLDMLEAQMNLRKAVQARSRFGTSFGEDEELDDEEGVIYVEGQEELDSGDEEGRDAVIVETSTQRRTKGGAESSASAKEQSDYEDIGNEMPTTTNGAIADSEDDGSDSVDDGFIDDEDSETDTDSGDEASEDDVNHDDIDSMDEEEESELEAPPSKRAAKMKMSNGLVTRKI